MRCFSGMPLARYRLLLDLCFGFNFEIVGPFSILKYEDIVPSRSHSRSHSQSHSRRSHSSSSSRSSQASKYSNMSEEDFEAEARRLGFERKDRGESSEVALIHVLAEATTQERLGLWRLFMKRTMIRILNFDLKHSFNSMSHIIRGHLILLHSQQSRQHPMCRNHRLSTRP